MPTVKTIPFENSFAEKMEGFYVNWEAEKAPKPEIIAFNDALCIELGLDQKTLNSELGAQIFSGNEIAKGSMPIAQVYAGHQFGGFSPQLGDGRALLLGEVIDTNGKRKDIQLKGSGRTPFSRNGDGKAVVAPILREYLMGEAMHALNIPTTRALAAVTTGDKVFRNGLEPGAVLTRVASSHLRVGTFQFFAAHKEHEKLKQLADYSIERHYPDLAKSKNRYLALLKTVMENQANLIAKWVCVGFIHGVMNTDNVTISGETIDYGPCAFMDIYNPKTVFSSIDEQGRYAYGNQPTITQWNLARFAETLIPLINPNDSDAAIALATNELNKFPELYQQVWLNEMRGKLGLFKAQEGDIDLVNELHAIIEDQKIDFTKLFRNLAEAARGDKTIVLSMFKDNTKIEKWLEAWLTQVTDNGTKPKEAGDAMDKVNPIYIPRNHLVEEALIKASKNEDYEPFQKLLGLLENPYEKRDGFEAYEDGAEEGASPHVTYCGT